MKVRDLKAIIDRFRDDDELVVSVKTLHGTIGPRPSIGVQSINAGFDWERGQVIITPKKIVHVGGEEFEEARKVAHNQAEALGFIWMAVTNKNMDAQQKLNAVKRTLRLRGFTGTEMEDE